MSSCYISLREVSKNVVGGYYRSAAVDQAGYVAVAVIDVVQGLAVGCAADKVWEPRWDTRVVKGHSWADPAGNVPCRGKGRSKRSGRSSTRVTLTQPRLHNRR